MNKKSIFIAGAAGLGILIAIVLFSRGPKTPSGKTSGGVSASALLSQARKAETGQDPVTAKKAYETLIGEFPNSREVSDWQKRVENLNIKMLFSSLLIPGSKEYEIQSGDSLEKIAKAHRTTVELLMKSNDLEDARIYPGKKLRVWNQPFGIVVDKSQNILLLKTGEELMKTYAVSTGSNNSTPVGTFKIIEKIVNPPWYKDGRVIPANSPENILGTRWMGWDKQGYGIHGTTEPQNLGKQVTAGCVRMANQDVEELFSIVPQGTEVTVVD